MAGGTLVVSKNINNHSYIKERFEAHHFTNITLTALKNDGLNMLIRETKPDQIIMGARFYESATPFRMKELRNEFPDIYMAAVTTSDYPADLGRCFITNKINAYLNGADGVELFRAALQEVRKGNEYVSPSAQREIDRRRDYPEAAGNITDRHIEIIRLVCSGWEEQEIADVLYMGKKTVSTHKSKIFRFLNARNPMELYRNAVTGGYIREDEIYFYPKNYTVPPLPEDKIKNRGLK